MPHAVTADRHASCSEPADAPGVDESWLTKPAGDDEERRAESALAQGGQCDLDIRGVTVVEGDADVVAAGSGVEHRKKCVLTHPYVGLAMIQRPLRGADTVEGQGDRTACIIRQTGDRLPHFREGPRGHRPTRSTGGGSLVQERDPRR